MLGGKQANRPRWQRVSPSRGDLHSARQPLARFRLQVHSRSITKNIFVVWRNRQWATSHSNVRRAHCRCRSHATLAAVRRKVRVFELTLEADAGCGHFTPPIGCRARLRVLLIGPQSARQWPRRPEFEARRSSFRTADRRASPADRDYIRSASYAR